jgi:hypothetical protein
VRARRLAGGREWLYARAVIRSLPIVAVPATMLTIALTAVAAPVTTPLSSRDFDVDLHVSAAQGSPRVIGMGGTTTALGEGAAGLLGNPAAAAMRPASSPDRWDWDLQLEEFAPGIGSDFDNNGITSSDRFKANVTSLALLGFFGPWGLGLGVQSVDYQMSAPPADPAMAVPTAQGNISAALLHVLLARSFLDGALTVGAGLRTGAFSLAEAGAESLFDVAGTSVETGLLVSPRARNWRWGVRLALPVKADAVDARCDPQDCRGLILPTRAVAPWEVAVGAAIRLAPVPWNIRTYGVFRDEPALVISAELVVTGALTRAGGLEAFLARQLQPSGRHTTFSPRLGLEKEYLPGRLRLRAGSYREPSRFEGVPARTHLTAGAELRLFSFRLWGAERRPALALALDFAPRYGNAGLSLGFWH